MVVDASGTGSHELAKGSFRGTCLVVAGMAARSSPSETLTCGRVCLVRVPEGALVIYDVDLDA
jgi:hypothetical protein